MRRYLNWLPALVWAGVIFFVSAQPKETFDRLGLTGHLLSIGGHFISFGLLMFLTALALYYGSKLPSKYILVTAFVLVALYGLSDEYHQSFVPGRTATLWDWLVDLLGALVVGLILVKRRLFEPTGSEKHPELLGDPRSDGEHPSSYTD